MAETSKNNGLEGSDDVVSNLYNVDNKKPSCSSVNSTAVVKEQLVDGHVGLHCAREYGGRGGGFRVRMT